MNRIVRAREGWRAATLEELVFFQRGYDITKAEQSPGDIPVISSSGIASYHSEPRAQGPGVVIGRKGSLGTIHFVDGPYWPHDTTLWSRNLKHNNPRFVYYFLHTIGLERYDVGNSNPTLNRNHIHGLPIAIPKYRIQERIASILSTYDDLIENNKRRIRLLEQAARLLYEEWFVHLRFPGHEHVTITDSVPKGWEKKTIADVCETVGGGTPSTKVSEYWDGDRLLEQAARLLYEEWFVHLRFPGHEHVTITDSVPKGWEKKTIADVCETVGGGTPSTKVSEYWDGDVTWIIPSDVTKNNCLVLLDSERKITNTGLRESSAKMVPAETILMTSRASVGFFALMDREVCTNQGFINLIPHDGEVRMYLLFNLMSRVAEIRGNAKGTTYPEISKGRFRTMDIVIPTKTLTGKFANIASATIRQLHCLKRSILRLTQTRNLILPRLMNGEITV